MRLILTFFTAFFCFSAHSQNLLNKKPAVVPALNEIVQEYFKNFSNSKGDTLSVQSGVLVFESKLKLPGATNCRIKKYAQPNNYAWEGILLQSEDFSEAAGQYKQLFRQLNNAKLTPNGFEKVPITGILDNPIEEKSFASTYFRFNQLEEKWQDFLIDLELTYQFPEWQIKILLYRKGPDDKMGIRAIEQR